ncbi:MAG: hypothetical protein RLY82_1305 [Pseudomonadota bacterium]|jgi:IS1 family transposase
MPFIFRLFFLLLLSVLLTSCTAVKLTYNNADSLVYFWLDGYVDFTVDQKVGVKNDIQALHTWHRQTQLPTFALMAKTLQVQAQGNVTAVQLCANWDQVEPTFMPPLIAHLEPAVLKLVSQMTPDQITSVEEKYAKTNKEWLKEWQPKTTRELHKNSEKAIRDRLENIYKSLSDDQVKLLRELIAVSPFDSKIAYAERLRRQQDMIATLKGARTKETLRALVQRNITSPDSTYRAYAARVKQSNCEMYAKIHNSMNESQRLQAVKTFQDYERDFKTLQAQK